MAVEHLKLCGDIAAFWSGSARLAIVVCVGVLIGGCAARRAPVSAPNVGTPDAELAIAPLSSTTGLASYYGPGFHGRTTASGVRFDRGAPVAAHPRFPFGTRVRVTNLSNRRQMVLTIVDRGPTPPNQREGVIIDVSEGAARSLGFTRKGRQRVRVDVLRWGDGSQ